MSRSPGGDSRVFPNNCIGCHAGMDPMAQAFAYYDFDETSTRMIYDSTAVTSEVLQQRRDVRRRFVTPDDHWHNHWRQGQNALLGWNPALPGEGIGAKSLGEELAGTKRLPSARSRRCSRLSVCAIPSTRPTAIRSTR